MSTARSRYILSAVIIALLAGAGIGLDRTGPVAGDQRAATLELVLNVPAARLDVYENGERTRTYDVAVGQPRHQTPIGEFSVSRVVWNPWWHPPESGWAADEEVTPPGPGNPMGRAKLYFRDLYYLHGTPHAGTVGHAASHGCVRMRNEDVIELARLVHRYASDGVSASLLDRLEANPSQTQTIWLDRPVGLSIVYDVVEVRDGKIEIHPDYYGRADRPIRDQVAEALASLGHPEEHLDEKQVAAVIRRSQQQSVVLPPRLLLRSSAPPVAAAAGSPATATAE